MVNLDLKLNWDLVKGVSNWISVNLADIGDPMNSDHFAFSYKTRNINNLTIFSLSLPNENGELIEFGESEKNHCYWLLIIDALPKTWKDIILKDKANAKKHP